MTSVAVQGPSRLVVGQSSGAGAVAQFSDGSAVDVTWLATWTSSAPAVATIDSWGAVAPLSPGATDFTAEFGPVTSPVLHLEVVERPTLQRIYLQNSSCYYYDYPRPGDAEAPTGPPIGANDIFLPPPDCQRIVRIGKTLQFQAIGEFDTGYYDDITDEVEWRLEPAGVGTVVLGEFTAVAAGATQLRAVLGAVQSDALDIRVVSQPTVVGLSIYASQLNYYAADGGPLRPGSDVPCFECGYFITLLRGDTSQLAATAHYDTGEWEDVSDRVTWRTSDGAVATVDATGKLTAAGAGDGLIDAQLGTVTSTGITVRVVNEATLQSLAIYMDGQDRAIGVGEQAVFHAIGYYDIGFQRDLTDAVTWQSSDTAVGGFDVPGTFSGRAAGSVAITAVLGEQESSSLPIEVYATSDLAYCDPAEVNRGIWSDDFNRVTLESDCADYTLPDVVELRFT
ncbi:MAG: Ig-like domain-containing protein, partial [Myxococcota bacterium]